MRCDVFLRCVCVSAMCLCLCRITKPLFLSPHFPAKTIGIEAGEPLASPSILLCQKIQKISYRLALVRGSVAGRFIWAGSVFPVPAVLFSFSGSQKIPGQPDFPVVTGLISHSSFPTLSSTSMSIGMSIGDDSHSPVSGI